MDKLPVQKPFVWLQLGQYTFPVSSTLGREGGRELELELEQSTLYGAQTACPGTVHLAVVWTCTYTVRVLHEGGRAGGMQCFRGGERHAVDDARVCYSQPERPCSSKPSARGSAEHSPPLRIEETCRLPWSDPETIILASGDMATH